MRCGSPPCNSETSRISSGMKATLSRRSVPPSCMTAAPSGVEQRMLGRPDGFAELAGFPAPSRRTKRFISSVRADKARWEKDSALRAVRNFENATSSWAHAAASRSRRAAEGASGAGALADDATDAERSEGVSMSGFELDSCAAPVTARLPAIKIARATGKRGFLVMIYYSKRCSEFPEDLRKTWTGA